MNNLLLELRKKKLINNWIWYTNYDNFILYNNIKLYPFVYHKDHINDIYYVNEYGITYSPNKKIMLYYFENMFIQNPYLL